MRRLKLFWHIIKRTASNYQDDKVPRLAAALAYYTLFSLAPLLVIILVVAGMFLEQQQIRTQIHLVARQYIGSYGASTIDTIMENVTRPRTSTAAGLVTLAVLFFGASNVFAQLKDALNTIMNVAPKPDIGIAGFVRDRLLALGMVVIVLLSGLIVLLLIVINTTISLITGNPFVALPGGNQIWQTLSLLFSWVVFTSIFGMMYKIVPDVKLSWRDALVGAGVGALLFVVGQLVVNWYLSRAPTQSWYGAAGSTIALLLWIYIAAQIVFIGAEFTQVFATLVGHGVEPTDNAMHVVKVNRDRLQEKAPSTWPEVEIEG